MVVAEIIEQTAAGAQERVGSVGSRIVNLGARGTKLNAIILARGGLVVADSTYDKQYQAKHRADRYTVGENKGELIYPNAPELIKPVLEETVIYIGHSVGTDDKAGLRNDDPDAMTSIDPSESKDYLLLNTGRWAAYLLSAEGISSNYWTGMNTYYLGDATKITAEHDAIAMHGLLRRFDIGIELSHAEALAWKG